MCWQVDSADESSARGEEHTAICFNRRRARRAADGGRNRSAIVLPVDQDHFDQMQMWVGRMIVFAGENARVMMKAPIACFGFCRERCRSLRPAGPRGSRFRLPAAAIDPFVDASLLHSVCLPATERDLRLALAKQTSTSKFAN